MTYPEKSLERLRDKIKDDRWTASVNSDGYPKVKIEGKSRLASHVLLESLGRPVPDGKVVMHRDNDPRNLDPKNLRIGTQQQNLKQMRDEGRDRPRGVPQEPDMKKHARIFWKYAAGGFGGLPPLTAQELENARKFQESMSRPPRPEPPPPIPVLPRVDTGPVYNRHTPLPESGPMVRYEDLHPLTASRVNRIAAERGMHPHAVSSLLSSSVTPGKTFDQFVHETGAGMGLNFGTYQDPREIDLSNKRIQERHREAMQARQQARAAAPTAPVPSSSADAPVRPMKMMGNPSSTPPAVPVPTHTPHVPAKPRIGLRPFTPALPLVR